ncbi:hypothetical protein MCETE7_01521 [Acidimicrobiia bacterium]
MSSYNPQRGRGRPVPSSTEQAPVDAILENHPVTPGLPEDIEIDVTPVGETVIPTVEATATAEIVADSFPQMPQRAPSFAGSPIVSSSAKPGNSKLVIALAAALAAVVAVVIWQRRRR